jgi:hypothetical protein
LANILCLNTEEKTNRDKRSIKKGEAPIQLLRGDVVNTSIRFWLKPPNCLMKNSLSVYCAKGEPGDNDKQWHLVAIWFYSKGINEISVNVVTDK